jgi:predicted membrane protein
MSHRRVAFVLTIMSFAYLTLAYFLQPFGINVIIGSLFVAGILFARLLSIKKPNRRKKDDFKADAITASFLDKRSLDSAEIKN